MITASTPGMAIALRRVDLLDVGVGVRAAHDAQEQHARQLDIVDVIALALQEALILHPFSTVADPLNYSITA